MLNLAQTNAAAARVEVEFLQGDATKWVSSTPFDAAVCLCEGGFGLIEKGESAEEHDHSILKNIAASLRHGRALSAYHP